MRVIKVTGWIVTGVVLGAFASSEISAMRAQQPSPRERLVVAGSPYPPTDSFGHRLAPAPYLSGSYRFIKDTQSGACWLQITEQERMALSPAPTQACDVLSSDPTR